jgi:hypothetical protein
MYGQSSGQSPGALVRMTTSNSPQQSERERSLSGEMAWEPDWASPRNTRSPSQGKAPPAHSPSPPAQGPSGTRTRASIRDASHDTISPNEEQAINEARERQRSEDLEAAYQTERASVGPMKMDFRVNFARKKFNEDRVASGLIPLKLKEIKPKYALEHMDNRKAAVGKKTADAMKLSNEAKLKAYEEQQAKPDPSGKGKAKRHGHEIYRELRWALFGPQ